MDPVSAAQFLRLAVALQQREQTEELSARLEEITTKLDDMAGKLDGLISAPWDEGLGVLRQAQMATSIDAQLELFRRAGEKFSDAAARRDVPLEIRTYATALSSLMWMAQGNRELAGVQASHATALAKEMYDSVRRLGSSGGYASEQDPLWNRLDQSEGLLHQCESLAAFLSSPGQGLGAELPLSLDDVPGTEPPWRPPPTELECVFYAKGGPSKLASVWHQLRDRLDDWSQVEWFADATDLRILATIGQITVYKPGEIVESGRLRFQSPLHGLQLQGGREWADDYVVMAPASSDLSSGYRVNLGPKGHGEQVRAALRRSVATASAAD